MCPRFCTGVAMQEQRVSLLPVPREDRTEKGWIMDKQGFRCIKKSGLKLETLVSIPVLGILEQFTYITLLSLCFLLLKGG